MAIRRKRPQGPLDLQAAIRSAGHNWTAGATSISALSESDRRARLGLKVDKAELEATKSAIRAMEALAAKQAFGVGAPASIDWRNNGGNWITPIKDQQNCGSCVSFGTCATIESRVRIACRNAGLAIDLSEADLFFCGCGNCCGPGWNFPPALNHAKTSGIANDADFVYTPSDQPCKPGLSPYVKITNWTAILPIADRKNVLAAKGPVVGGLAIYSDFYNYVSGVYRHVSGGLEGYHAVSVVGYDDVQQCWICKNSWGPGWGDAGFFRIGYGEAEMDTAFAFYDVEVGCPSLPTPTDTCAIYLPLLRRALELARVNPAFRQCLRYYVCGRLPRTTCSAAQMQVVNAVRQVLQRCPQYRVPFCRALG